MEPKETSESLFREDAGEVACNKYTKVEQGSSSVCVIWLPPHSWPGSLEKKGRCRWLVALCQESSKGHTGLAGAVGQFSHVFFILSFDHLLDVNLAVFFRGGENRPFEATHMGRQVQFGFMMSLGGGGSREPGRSVLVFGFRRRGRRVAAVTALIVGFVRVGNLVWMMRFELLGETLVVLKDFLALVFGPPKISLVLFLGGRVVLNHVHICEVNLAFPQCGFE